LGLLPPAGALKYMTLPPRYSGRADLDIRGALEQVDEVGAQLDPLQRCAEPVLHRAEADVSVG
jgi:hypothetical protein